MVKVKICGITNLDDASVAIRYGASALGFIFTKSPRQVSPEKASKIIRALPPFVKTLGVFIDEDPANIRQIMELCGLDLVQLHGDESPEFCRAFMPRAVKALRIKDDVSIQSIRPYQENVRALLLDTYSDNLPGGTGKIFDWDMAIKIKKLGVPIILSGGLGPSNIDSAISRVRPYAVDVNSGVEERPGKKSHTLMKELFEKTLRIIAV